jgi:ABC-type sugar transport system permease subunit
MNFIGFGNYMALFRFDFFWKSLLNTLFYFVSHSIPVMVISFLLAVAISSKIVGWKNFYKVCFFLPVTMSSVSATLIWKVILSTRTGAINNILGTQIPFLDSTELFRWSVIIIIVWKSVGYNMMIFIAGLTTVNHEIYEAARVDGASTFRSLISITIPIMKPIFLFAVLMDTMSSLKLFTEPRLLGAVDTISPEANTLVGILVDNMNAGMFGMASALGSSPAAGALGARPGSR